MAIQHYFDRAKVDYDEVYEAGKKSRVDEFSDNYQNYGKRDDYNYAFYGAGWNDTTYNPKYPIKTRKNGNGAANLFAWSNITDTKVDIEVIGSTSTSLFAQCQLLVTIIKLIVDEATKFTSYFVNCRRLVDITIEGTIGNNLSFYDSPKLSKASITSVINALSTTTSGLTVTFSKTAVETAFGSTTSTEWLALVATKSNWTISLV